MFRKTYPLKHLKKWLYWPWGDYRVLRDATAVLFTCEEERRLARESFWLYRCNEHVINYGTSAPIGQPDAQRRLFLERFPHLADKRCVLFLGRVHVKKGPDLLFRAFAELLRDLPFSETAGLHLVMAGPNDHAYGVEMQRRVVELGLTERVTWTGMLTGDLKWGAFHAAEVFVLASHQENFGISVAEALACGVPVLISNKVNIWREILADGAGLVETDDVAGTLRLLQRWLALPTTEKQTMRQAAGRCFAERFDVKQTGVSFAAALRQFGVKMD